MASCIEATNAIITLIHAKLVLVNSFEHAAASSLAAASLTTASAHAEASLTVASAHAGASLTVASHASSLAHSESLIGPHSATLIPPQTN